MLSRLYFLGLLDPAERPAVLRRIIARIESGLAALTALSEHLDTLDVPDEQHDSAVHQRATLDYGLAAHRHALDCSATTSINTTRPAADRTTQSASPSAGARVQLITWRTRLAIDAAHPSL